MRNKLYKNERAVYVDQYSKGRDIIGVMPYEYYYEGDPLVLCKKCGYPKGDHGVLTVYKGNGKSRDLCPGDWIIKSGDKTYICNKDDLDKTIKAIP